VVLLVVSRRGQSGANAHTSGWSHWATIPMDSAFWAAGGTGIAPAPCGCGACCPSFRDVRGHTWAGWKSPILIIQSTWTFTSVRRRWGQQWGQAALRQSHWTLSPRKTQRGSAGRVVTLYARTTPGTYQRSRIVAVQAVGMMTYPPHIARPGRSLVLFGGGPRVSSSGTVANPLASTLKAAPVGGVYAW